MNVGTKKLTEVIPESGLSINRLSAEVPAAKPAALSLLLDALSVLILLTVLAASFSKTIFAGQSVSRLALTAEWDSLFHTFCTGKSSLYDPSLIQLFGPQYFLVGKFFQQGFLPLWNPYNGFGCPLIGDIQASVFSPLRVFFNLAPGILAWNYMLLGELALCAVGSYILARYLKLGRIASLFSAVLYTFCPFNMWYLELNTGTASCIFPLTFYLFARAARLRTKASSIIAGLGCSLLILSGHPESAFFGIALGSFLMMCLMLLDPTLTSGQISRLLNFRKGLTLTGFTTLALTAPVLFPFIEYLLNSDTYKYESVSSAHVPWPGVIEHCLNPASGAASPYLGIVAAICLPLAVFAFRKKSSYRPEVVSVLITAVVAFLLVTQLGQLEPLFSQPPLTMIVTRYCLPVLLLTLPLLAGFGLSELFSLKTDCQKSSTDEIAAGEPGLKEQPASLLARIPKKLSTLSVAILVCIALPWLLKDCGDWMKACSFDLMLPAPTFNVVAWKRDIVCALVVLALAVVGWFTRKHLPGSAFAALVLIPAFISVAAVSKASLPPQPAFNYPEVAPLANLKDPQWRCLATGDHLFRPAVNAVYSVPDVQVHNPVFPKRYMAFIKACGAKVDMFNQKFGTDIHPLLKVASAKYILSQLPVNHADAATPPLTELVAADKPVVFNNEVCLSGLKLWSANTAAGGTIAWRVTTAAASRYSYALVLFDSKRQVLWFGDQKMLVESDDAGEAFSIPLALDKGKSSEQLALGVQLYDRKNNQFVTPSAATVQDTSVIVAWFATSSGSTANNYSLPLVAQYADQVRLYELPGALPRAYVVHRSTSVKNEAEALSYIQSKRFDPAREVILEEANTTLPPQEMSEPSTAFTKATLEQQGPNEVQTRFKSALPGFLVLNDVYYPGWKAFLDGKEVPITRANFLFRAVAVPAGEHTVQFSYQPLSLIAGLAFSLLFILGVGFSAIKYAITKKR